MDPYNSNEDMIWDDGEWVVLKEYEVHKPNQELESFYEDLLHLAEDYHQVTGRHLAVYGDIGELFGAIAFGIKLHKNNAMGSDGRLGNDFIEIKTMAPFGEHDRVVVNRERHFNKLLIVKIDAEFCVSGKLIDRKDLPKRSGNMLRLKWDQFEHKPVFLDDNEPAF